MRQVVLFQLGPRVDQHVQAGFLHRWFNLTHTQINAFSLGPDLTTCPIRVAVCSPTVYVCPVGTRTHILCYQNTGISLSNANASPRSVDRTQANPPPARLTISPRVTDQGKFESLIKTHSLLHTTHYTGNSEFRIPSPDRSMAMPMYGPTTGTLRAKPAMVPRKSPNSTMMPYSSTRKPISGHLKRISASPAKKAAVPLSFCLRAKKTSVFCGPMMMVRPMRKRIWEGSVSEVWVGEGGRRGGYISHGEHGAVEEEHDAAYEEEAACLGEGVVSLGGSVAGS